MIILVWILKTLAIIIALILLVILLVLLTPVRYRLNADYKTDLSMYVKATWLLRIFTVVYDTNSTPVFKLKIFGREGLFKRKSKQSKSYSDGSLSKIKKSKNKNNETQNNESEKKRRKTLDMSELTEKWHSINEYPYKDALIKKTILLIKRLIKALLPSHAEGQCCFGFDDPSTTGILLGAAHAFCGIADLYENLQISADFEKKYLDLKCGIAGRLRLGSFLWPLIVYTLSKPVWIIIKPMIFSKKTKG